MMGRLPHVGQEFLFSKQYKTFKKLGKFPSIPIDHKNKHLIKLQ